MRPRRGRRLPNGTVVLQGSTSTGIRQMRCTACRGLAVPVGQQGLKGGRTIYRCTSPGCGVTFQTSKL
jgi:hypothetical protein